MQLNGFFGKNWRLLWMVICFFQIENLPGQVTVELEKTNVLMLSFPNPISVTVSDVPDSCLSLRPSGGAIQKKGLGYYEWISFPDTTILSLEIIDTCHNELIAERTYRVHEMGVSILLGAYHHSKTIMAGTFKAQGGIAAVGLECCECKCDMIGFSAQFYSKKTGELWAGYNKGARFAGGMVEKCQAVMPGDWVRFYQFSYQCPGMKQPKFSDEELNFGIK